jgi:guanylate kinase
LNSQIVAPGQLVVISGPSGAGKSTICKILVSQNSDFSLSVSATTRSARKNEQEGVDYFFLSEKEFIEHIEKEDFIEYEMVHGHYYGTLSHQIEGIIGSSNTVLLDIDVNGALKLKKNFPQAILIFIQPPSLRELKRRLRGRKSDTEEQIKNRLARLPDELEKAKYFDHQIVNRDLDNTIKQITVIIRQKQKREQNVPHQSL